jgi:hypothetical protein
MAFGQQMGVPASRQQLQTLLELLQAAGHTDFRDARAAMGFNQRQGGGKFTRDEAEAFIEHLQNDEAPDAEAPVVRTARLSATEVAIRKLPAEALAAELQRRGWVVMEP